MRYTISHMSRRLIIILLIVLVVGVIGGAAVLVMNRLRGGTPEVTQTTTTGQLGEAELGGQNIVNPAGDDDGDGLTNADEALWGTDKKNPDTDGDNFLDGEEVKANYNPTIPSPNDKLPEGFKPGKDLQPLETAASQPVAVDQFFQTNLDLTLGTKNYTDQYRSQVTEKDRTPDTLDAFIKAQPIITKLPTPTDKAILLQEKDTPNVLSEYIFMANTVDASFSDRTTFAQAINDVFGKNEAASMAGLATIMKLQQEKLITQRVPPAALNLHKLLLGYAQLLEATFNQITKYNEDEVRAVLAMRQWEENDKLYIPLIEHEIDRLQLLAGQD